MERRKSRLRNTQQQCLRKEVGAVSVFWFFFNFYNFFAGAGKCQGSEPRAGDAAGSVVRGCSRIGPGSAPSQPLPRDPLTLTLEFCGGPAVPTAPMGPGAAIMPRFAPSAGQSPPCPGLSPAAVPRSFSQQLLLFPAFVCRNHRLKPCSPSGRGNPRWNPSGQF